MTATDEGVDVLGGKPSKGTPKDKRIKGNDSSEAVVEPLQTNDNEGGNEDDTNQNEGDNEAAMGDIAMSPEPSLEPSFEPSSPNYDFDLARLTREADYRTVLHRRRGRAS